jgi:hypothetical protein
MDKAQGMDCGSEAAMTATAGMFEVTGEKNGFIRYNASGAARDT